MNCYTFSKKGKIKVLVKLVLLFGVLISTLIFISRFAYLYFITWLPIMWLSYNFICGIFYVCTTVFFINEKELIAKSGLGISNRILWQEIEKIEITKHKSKVSGLKILTKDKKKNLILSNAIENYEELFNEIKKIPETQYLISFR